MATLSDARLPFTFEYPDVCEVQWESSSKSQPFLNINSRELKFHLNLMWGPDYDGVEYVFTGDWNARKEIDKCVSTIRFK